ncbi:hypothetical protein AUC68_05090 [Methyloceanibacter methanicus]|uniref:Uncharacterized protein n=1 Tax=Methyloceanibacter methanicus TaxID=1774968 RepID=A0A1E3W1F6_9HYPH|nr:hypothetical protein AUC68_05090 [Methyloceanibacter methanicus]
MEQAVGEHMPALPVGGDLDFVDGDEIGLQLARHGLHRADEEARARRLDLLLARDERNLARSGFGDDLLVDLAREQPQRQTDDPHLVGKHALDGEMRLAGIGGAEHGRHATPAIGRAMCPGCLRTDRPGACGLCG